jgi:hypothetical protein
MNETVTVSWAKAATAKDKIAQATVRIAALPFWVCFWAFRKQVEVASNLICVLRTK